MNDRKIIFVDEVAYMLPEKVYEEWMKVLEPYERSNINFTQIYKEHKHGLLNVYKFVYNNKYKTKEFIMLSLGMEEEFVSHCLNVLLSKRFISCDRGDFKNGYKDHYYISGDDYEYKDVIRLLESEQDGN